MSRGPPTFATYTGPELAGTAAAPCCPEQRRSLDSPVVKLTCPNCGTRYDSADEPACGRVYSIRCVCGKRIVAAGAAPAARPGPGPRYDRFAESHGLLIDEAEARALAAGSPVLEARVEAARGDEVEVMVTFSTAVARPAPEKKDAKAPARREAAAAPTTAAAPTAAVPPAWIVPAAALIAFLAAGGGAAWFLLPDPGTTLATTLAVLPPFDGARHEASAPLASPWHAEPASPPVATAAALGGSSGKASQRASAEPARQGAAATRSAPRDSGAGARKKPMASRSQR